MFFLWEVSMVGTKTLRFELKITSYIIEVPQTCSDTFCHIAQRLIKGPTLNQFDWLIIAIYRTFACRQRRRQEEPKDPSGTRKYRRWVWGEGDRLRKNFRRRNWERIRSTRATGVGILPTQVPANLLGWHDARGRDLGVGAWSSHDHAGRNRERRQENAASAHQRRRTPRRVLLWVSSRFTFAEENP